MNETIKVGSIVTDKRILSKLKRKGFIWNYSQWGYLEDLRIRTNDNLEFTLCLSNNGKCKVAEKFENAMWEKWRQGQANTEMTFFECNELFGANKFTWEGMVFSTKYIGGCFNPFLIRIE